jgi:ABC-type uncharacterized transport system ATPase subunit
VETAVDHDRVAAIEGVELVEFDGRELTVTLAEGSPPRRFLARLLEQGDVSSFRIRTPSLHEVFVQLVAGGEDHDAD